MNSLSRSDYSNHMEDLLRSGSSPKLLDEQFISEFDARIRAYCMYPPDTSITYVLCTE